MNAARPGRIHVRTATAQDREAVLRIAASAMREFGLEPDFDGLDADLGRIGLGDPRAVAEYVAECGGAVCAEAVVSAKTTTDAKLSGFYVDPARRGQGLGRVLLQSAILATTQAGYTRLSLETWGRMAAAVRLYESLGWVRGADPPPHSGADRSYMLTLR